MGASQRDSIDGQFRMAISNSNFEAVEHLRLSSAKLRSPLSVEVEPFCCREAVPSAEGELPPFYS